MRRCLPKMASLKLIQPLPANEISDGYYCAITITDVLAILIVPLRRNGIDNGNG
jgi:hypothetical protein